MVLWVNPGDTSTFDLQYHFQKIPATLFNPYLVSYTSFPLDRGTVEFNGSWAVREGRIKSQNHLLIIDPRVSKRVKNKNTNWLPLPLIMSFIREYGNVIDYEIPITGNLKNPRFHWNDVIFDLLRNIFIKPPTTPYRMEVKKLENQIENSLALKWRTGQVILQPEQEKFISKMADFLSENPAASIGIYPKVYADKEKEHTLFFEAKKKYFLTINKEDEHLFAEEDSEKVEKMSVKDSLFVRYLNKQVNDNMLFTIQEKCSRLINAKIVNDKLKQLNKQRETAFLSFFK